MPTPESRQHPRGNAGRVVLAVATAAVTVALRAAAAK